MAGSRYPVGTPVIIRVQWTDTNPDSVTFGQVVSPVVTAFARGPGEAEQSPAVTGPDATGYYTARVTPDVPGQWWYGFSASGTYQGYVEDVFVAYARRA